jgi:hypothetical protein
MPNLPPEAWSEAAEREAIRQEGCNLPIDVCKNITPADGAAKRAVQAKQGPNPSRERQPMGNGGIA